MTFLQPFVLFGLPLVLTPVIIHLLNRLRHRPKPWAAMRFLVSATRSTTARSKLRQFLILACRVLAVAALIFFVARPLAGGWLGWALSSAPDAILILLDRSASMETQNNGTSRRQEAIQMLTQAAGQFEETSHLILIDSVTRAPQEISRATNLAQLPITGPSDTAADLPAMLRAAFDWLVENRAGSAEIWIASDNQRSNWLPDDSRWKNLLAQFGGLSQKVRVRLLDLGQTTAAPNASISIRELLRRPRGDGSELQVTLDLERNRNTAATLPVTLTLDGGRSETDIKLDGPALRWRHRIDLGNRREGGWGSFALSGDANLHDNTAYFVYGPDVAMRAVAVSTEKDAVRSLRYAAATRAALPAQWISISDFAGAPLDGVSLLLWQAPLPSGVEADRVQSFVNEGGTVVFFPPGEPDGRQFSGMGWGDVQNASEPEGFRVLRWNEEEGPLARSDEHLSLPLPQTSFARRQAIVGRKDILAAFDDGAAFLARQTLGKGEVFFCSVLPQPGWSSLGDGPVLVPMLQRLLLAGGRRLQQVSTVACGEMNATDSARQWVSVDSTTSKDIRSQAGIYRSGDRLIAVNRPAAEDDPEMIDTEQARKLFADLPTQTWQEHPVGIGRLQGEIWRLFAFAMLLLLMAEGILILPTKAVPSPHPTRPAPESTRRQEQPA
ncbi:MAG: BatA domain-containing protein [Limisphaerales bacterium]